MTDTFAARPNVQLQAVTPWTDPRLISRTAAAVGVMIGTLVLVGWLADVAQLRALGPASSASVNPMTALGLVCLGSAMWLMAHAEHVRAREIARALALLVTVIGVARLYGILFGESPGVDQLLFGDAMQLTADGRANRMSPNAALNLSMLGTALLLQVRASRLASVLGQLASVIVLFSAQAALIAFAYQSGWFEGFGSFNKMALPVAIAFAALSIGAMTLSSDDGIIAIVLSDGPGGSLARTLLPAGFLVPAVLGWLVLFSHRGGQLDAELADTLFVLATILVFVGIVAFIATQLHETHLDRARSDAALRESEVRFRLIAENGSDVVSLHDTDGRVLYVSPSCERVLGFLPDEMSRMAPFAIVHPEDQYRLQRHFNQLLRGEPVTSIQCRMLHKTGRHIWLDMMWRAVTGDDGQVERLQVSSRDITESKQYAQRLEEAQRKLKVQQQELHDVNQRLKSLADTDGLTGLKNRRAFQEKLEEEVSRANRYGHPVSLMLLDIDHFKSYNDTFGHPRGDEVLRNVGRLLSRSVRNMDYSARYGGEEFAVVLPNTERESAEGLAERLRLAIEGASWEDRPVTISVGVATFSNQVSTAELLIERADRALYRSKERGRNRVTAAE